MSALLDDSRFLGPLDLVAHREIARRGHVRQETLYPPRAVAETRTFFDALYDGVWSEYNHSGDEWTVPKINRELEEYHFRKWLEQFSSLPAEFFDVTSAALGNLR